MQSVQVSYALVPLLIAGAVQGAEDPNGAKRGSDSGHDSIVSTTNELLTRERERESGDPIPHSLCVMFARNTLISELRKRQT